MSKEGAASGKPPGQMPPGFDDPNLMSFMQNFTKDMLGGEGGGAGGPAGMDGLMNEFSKFLKESEGNEEMKSALDSVVNELLTKDTLYEPMKSLRDEYPNWLENNWDKVSQKDLEMYNN